MPKRYNHKTKNRYFHKNKQPQRNKKDNILGWILKRVLLIFVSKIVAILLIIIGAIVCTAAMFAASGWTFFVGVIILLPGLFINKFSHALEKWIEVK